MGTNMYVTTAEARVRGRTHVDRTEADGGALAGERREGRCAWKVTARGRHLLGSGRKCVLRSQREARGRRMRESAEAKVCARIAAVYGKADRRTEDGSACLEGDGTRTATCAGAQVKVRARIAEARGRRMRESAEAKVHAR